MLPSSGSSSCIPSRARRCAWCSPVIRPRSAWPGCRRSRATWARASSYCPRFATWSPTKCRSATSRARSARDRRRAITQRTPPNRPESSRTPTGRSSGLVDALFASLPERLAQLGLQDLARAALGERVSELDAAWDLEVRQLRPHVLAEVLHRGRCALLEDHQGDGHLAPSVVWSCDDRAL